MIAAIRIAKVLSVAVLALTAGVVGAQERYPSRPVEIVVPWGPGGGADQLARLTATLLEPMLKTSFPVVNVPGATGATGMAKLLADQADGYAMAVYIADSNALLAGPSPRWSMNDIQPVAVMMQVPSFIFVAQDSRFKAWADFEKEARAKPKTLKVATLGFGSVDDMTLTYLASKGIQVVEVPYAKPSERYVSVIGGHVDALYEQAGDVRQFLDSHQIRPLILFGKERLAAFKDIPASYELGYKIALPQFRSYVVKAGTPPDRVKTLADALAKAVATPEYKKFLSDQYADPNSYIDPQGSEAYFKTQLDDMKAAQQAASR
ncbi:MAG TPA: tripartite tricarboxylate transporter substrate binding protein [Casimicrobiaceae bacterium]|jgi:tripartite-type tricarboxylate transporter receptor subunit TctC|nr:tripartite tricarboxylate transporter substrate binding protein [Casimicrobiaceae bacterium]